MAKANEAIQRETERGKGKIVYRTAAAKLATGMSVIHSRFPNLNRQKRRYGYSTYAVQYIRARRSTQAPATPARHTNTAAATGSAIYFNK